LLSYEDEFVHAHPEIDELREKMFCVEKEQYSKDYHDPEKRSIANSLQVEFKDGNKTADVEIEYPLGHRRRRQEAIPELEKKFLRNLNLRFASKQVANIKKITLNEAAFLNTSVIDFVEAFTL
jgi:2-methylcitrate dehydratase